MVHFELGVKSLHDDLLVVEATNDTNTDSLVVYESQLPGNNLKESKVSIVKENQSLNSKAVDSSVVVAPSSTQTQTSTGNDDEESREGMIHRISEQHFLSTRIVCSKKSWFMNPFNHYVINWNTFIAIGVL